MNNNIKSFFFALFIFFQLTSLIFFTFFMPFTYSDHLSHWINYYFKYSTKMRRSYTTFKRLWIWSILTQIKKIFKISWSLLNHGISNLSDTTIVYILFLFDTFEIESRWTLLCIFTHWWHSLFSSCLNHRLHVFLAHRNLETKYWSCSFLYRCW